MVLHIAAPCLSPIIAMKFAMDLCTLDPRIGTAVGLVQNCVGAKYLNLLLHEIMGHLEPSGP